jgi:CRP-like cAMP-binding protein/nucleotide-binding universal stress UspA family protein
MYQNVLVPLDRSAESEGVLDVVPRLVNADGKATLLTVIPPGRTRSMGELVILGSQQEEEDRSRALAYLNRISNRLKQCSVDANTAVVVNVSVPAAIVAYANRNSVDLISMFTHDRRGLARLVKGSVAREVERRAVMPVRVFRPEDLSPSIEVEDGEPGHDFDYGLVDMFSRLSREQVSAVVALGRIVSVKEGETLGAGGEAGQNLFIIQEGEAQVTAHAEVGEIAVRVAGAGESFPQAVLLGEGTLITAGFALSDMTLLQIPRAPLLDLCTQDAAIGRGIYAATAQLFAHRYSRTLNELGVSVTREMESDSGQTEEEED